MEQIMGLLLGTLNLFYPLLLGSVITFIYALIRRSSIPMLISAILLFPIAWFIGAHPPFPWAIFLPLIQVLLAIVFYLLNKRKVET
ncbi:hypothetical protein [Sporosarcina sp. HYO08]|uniref:hypothetical protein n=1 Tax=Sporosarcina sp. HYO08 TaxID=1759557 RepID=UPI0007942CE7|nr:hypothetical protein [Sporosarcina sp. HYO08]KXH80866.1 hypothetical protein AU377_09040 [Sporosarcina sp. HYO08]